MCCAKSLQNTLLEEAESNLIEVIADIVSRDVNKFNVREGMERLNEPYR